MYNVDVKKAIERIIGYIGEDEVNVRENDLVDIDVRCGNISSLEELGYLLVVEKVGDFNCGICSNLKDLRGSPRVVYGNFDCYDCDNLESLEGGPSEVYGNFDCRWCKKLKEIKFDVKRIAKSLGCAECESLEYIDEGVVEKVEGMVYIMGCKNIKNIKELRRRFGNKIDKNTVYYGYYI